MYQHRIQTYSFENKCFKIDVQLIYNVVFLVYSKVVLL